MEHAIEQVAIIGAGALGGIYGSLLYLSDPGSVHFIADGARQQRLQEEGIVVNGTRYPIPARRPEQARPVDLVIVAVKHHQLDQALDDMKQAVGAGTVILSVMNGIDSEQRIGARFGSEKVLYGLALGIDAVREASGITYRNQGRILFGEPKNQELSGRVRRVGALFDRAGIAHLTPPDMIRSLWFKFMVNVGANQVSAVLGANYGTLRETDLARQLMEAAMQEVILLAQAEQVALSEADIEEWYRVLGSLDAAGKTSMLQDVEAGRKTEVEMLAGTVIELGKRHGIPTPVNGKLFEDLRQIEATGRR
jgi:2-dehydropantoate 2-reductase